MPDHYKNKQEVDVVKCISMNNSYISCLRKWRSLVKFVGYSKGFDQKGDRMSMNNENLPYLH